MKFLIDIDMENAAFQEGKQAWEVSRILVELARQLTTNKRETMLSLYSGRKALLDINGNTVGYATIDNGRGEH